MSPTAVQIPLTAADPGDPAKDRYVTIALPGEALAAAMASAGARPVAQDNLRLRAAAEDWHTGGTIACQHVGFAARP